MEEVIKLEQVSYEYENVGRYVKAVRMANYTFEKGKMYAIVGKSGSGKSTLMSILSGMRSPTSGRVIYCEKDLADMDMETYRQKEIALIHQAYHLFPRLTALENVCYPLELIGVPLKKAEEIAVAKLKEVGLREEQGRSYPANLSGGEQQRVAIARALAKGVKVILADEPTGNLDNENTELVIRLLQNLTKDGYCVIVVTHDDEVASEADICLNMDEGNLQVG